MRGDFTDYRGMGIVQNRPNWRMSSPGRPKGEYRSAQHEAPVSVFQTGALPYFEVPPEFNAELGAFLGL